MDTDKTDYPHTLSSNPDYSMVNVTIPAGKTLRVESSAMTYMDSSIEMKASMKGGVGRFFSGESIVISEYSAPGQSAEMGFAPGTPGDIQHVYLENETVYLENSAFLASGPDVEVSGNFQGFKGFFSGEGLFMARCTGTGDLWFNTFGALVEIDVTDNYVVDTGHIVAFTEGLSYTVRPLAGFKSFVFSGEGLVCEFSGSGRVWIQTRKAPAFVFWADAFRRVQKSKNDND